MSVIFCLLLGIDPLESVGAAQRSKAAPVVVPSDECECGCGGTGVVGDGTIEMPCQCKASCSCKAGKDAPQSPVEAILEAPKSAPVCVDGSCGKPVKSAPVARRGIFGWRRR